MSAPSPYPWATPYPTPAGIVASGASELPYASQIAAQLEGSSGLSGLLGRLPSPSFASLPSGTSIVPAAAEGAGILGRIAPYAKVAAPALIGHAVAERVPGGDNPLSSAGRGAALGAGVGASLGLAGGPFAEITVPVGAGVGAGIGAAGNLLWDMGLSNLFGGDDDKPTDDRPIDQRVADFARAQGLDPTRYTSQLEIAKQAAAVTGEEFDDVAQANAAKTLVGQIVSDAQTSRVETAQRQEAQYAAHQQQISDQNFTLALQAQSAQYFQPYIQNILQGGTAQADALRGLAAQVPPSFRGIYEQQANMAQANAQSLAGAYAAQATMSPAALYQQVQGQSLANQQAQVDLAYKQALANQANAQAQYYASGGAGSGGRQSFDDVVAAQQSGG